MSLFFDQNLSRRLPARLTDLFPGSEHISTALPESASDREIWEYAAKNGLAVVTKDSDYRDMSSALGAPPKVVWLRIENTTTAKIEALLRSRSVEILVFLNDQNTAFLELP